MPSFRRHKCACLLILLLVGPPTYLQLRIVHTLPVEADLEQLLALVRQLDEEADLWQEGERNPLLMQPPRDEEADDSGTEERASAAQVAEGELSEDEEGEVKSDAGEEEGEVVAAAKPAETPGASVGKDVKESPTAVWESQLALYLRIVHSYDFYTAKDAPIEDGMATRYVRPCLSVAYQTHSRPAGSIPTAASPYNMHAHPLAGAFSLAPSPVVPCSLPVG